MPTPLASQIQDVLPRTRDAYYKLVLAVGLARTGKTTMLTELAAQHSWPRLNVNLRLSERLLELTHRQRATRVAGILDDMREAFFREHVSDARLFPGGFEMLLVPGAFVAGIVHAPIGQHFGLPVPLGFVSFDRRVLERAGELLDANAEVFKLEDVLRRNLVAPPVMDKKEDGTEEPNAAPAAK